MLIACWMLWRTGANRGPTPTTIILSTGTTMTMTIIIMNIMTTIILTPGAPLVAEEWQDAHQRAHAQEINRRFDGRR